MQLIKNFREKVVSCLSSTRSYLSILLVFFLFNFSWGSQQAGRLKDGPKSFEYMPGRLTIKLKETVPGFKLKPNNGKFQVTASGASSLDQLNAKYSVYNIWNIFPGESPRPKSSGLPDLSGYYEIQFPEVFNLDSVLAEYSRDPNLELVEKVAIYYLDTSIPNDPNYPNQWYLSNVRDNDMDMLDAWDYERGDSSVVLGIVDTGILYKHAELGGEDTALYSTDGNIWVNWPEYNGSAGVDDDGNGYVDDVIGWDWVHVAKGWGGEDLINPDNDPKDFNGHGTHVAGIAAAMNNNSNLGTGIAGGWYPAEPGCKLMALRAGWSDTVLSGGGYYEGGRLEANFIASAINYATQKGVTAVNNSWGGGPYNSSLKIAMRNAVANGVVVVKSAGNDGSQSPPDFISDSIPEAIQVAATDSLDKKADYSNYGNWVDVSAPGSNIFSTYSFHYGVSSAFASGTSMSAPMVTGLAGLFKSKIPAATGADIKNWITSTADNIDTLNPAYAGKLGSGRVNALNFLSSIPSPNFSAAPLIGKIPLAVNFTNTSSGTIDSVSWNFGDSQNDTASNPVHVYLTPGIYGPALTAFKFSFGFSTTQESLVVAAADTVAPGKGMGGAGQNTVPVTLYVKNLFPTTGMKIPLRYGDGTIPLEATSVQFLGRANSFQTKSAIIDPDSQTILINLMDDTAVAPGSGLLAKIIFKISNSASVGDTLWIEETTVPPGDSLLFTTSLGSFEPFYVAGFVTVEPYRAGDVNKNGSINLTDIIYLVNYLYKGGPGPNPSWLGDVTFDGVTNLVDLVFLVNFIYKGGPGP